jgi:hypothetical protein
VNIGKRVAAIVVFVLVGLVVLLSIQLRPDRTDEIHVRIETSDPDSLATLAHQALPDTTDSGPQPTLVPTLTTSVQSALLEELGLPLRWPVQPFTDTQIEEVRECDFIVPAGIFTQEAQPDEAGSLPELSACEWAAIAAIRREGNGESSSLVEFSRAFKANPAYAFAPELISKYFDVGPLVESPPFTTSPIESVELYYDFATFGHQVTYDLTIRHAGTASLVSGTGTENYGSTPVPIPTALKSETVQALRSAFDNLLPIEQAFSVEECCDNYPDWQITIHFLSGYDVVAATNSSNRIGGGGPWQIEIDGQHYIQYSPSLLHAAENIMYEIGLFSSSGSYWGFFDPPADPLFNYLFP